MNNPIRCIIIVLSAALCAAGWVSVYKEDSVSRHAYVDVAVFSKAGEDCAEYLVKGQEVGNSARLQWREWDASDGSGKRQAHELIAHRVDCHFVF